MTASYDLAIENAKIVDGTGSPWFRGAVAIDGHRIEAVTRDDREIDSHSVIDADGDVVCPGFIDTHSHSDLQLFEDSTLEPKLRQGITTEIVGQDGFSVAPVEPHKTAEWASHLSGLTGDCDVEWSWETIGEYLDTIDAAGIGPNVGTLIGHGTVRFAVMGMRTRSPTTDELDAMGELVSAGLEAGAFGFSTGLIYSPQVNADTREVRTLVESLTPFGRPFVAHIRSEGQRIWDALDEFVDIGSDTEVPVHLSHFKVAGGKQHGKAKRANAFIETARERGIDFTAEQYPYTAGNTVLTSVLPPWVQKGDPESIRSQLEDQDVRDRIRNDIEKNRLETWENPALRTGWVNIIVRNVDSPAYEQYDGMNLAEIADDRCQHPVESVCDLLVAEELSVNIITHAMIESDVREILTSDRVCIATDGLFGAAPHPRTYGTYPRILGHYVRTENVLTLEEAIRKMTAFPARVLGIQTKGVLRPGMDADLVVFDPNSVGSPATFDNPTRNPRGISHVVVNGKPTIKEGELTGELPGRTLRA